MASTESSNAEWETVDQKYLDSLPLADRKVELKRRETVDQRVKDRRLRRKEAIRKNKDSAFSEILPRLKSGELEFDDVKRTEGVLSGAEWARAKEKQEFVVVRGHAIDETGQYLGSGPDLATAYRRTVG